MANRFPMAVVGTVAGLQQTKLLYRGFRFSFLSFLRLFVQTDRLVPWSSGKIVFRSLRFLRTMCMAWRECTIELAQTR